MNRRSQVFARESWNPRSILSAPGAEFGDDHQAIRVGMKRSLDNQIRHMRAVIVAGIDMIHAARDGLSQNCDRSVDISWRSPYHFFAISSGQLHGAVTHAVYSYRGAGQSEIAREISLFNHSVPPCYNHWMKDSSGLEFAYAG